MKAQLFTLLLLTSTISAEPIVFIAERPSKGRILLVAEDGREEAEALARCRVDCALSHAKNAAELAADLEWTRGKFGYNVSAVSLGSKAPLVKELDNLSVAGRICVDPESLGGSDPFEFLGEIPSHRGRLRDENIHLLILVTTDDGVSTINSSSQYWKNASGTITEKDSAAQQQLRRWIAAQQL